MAAAESTRRREGRTEDSCSMPQGGWGRSGTALTGYLTRASQSAWAPGRERRQGQGAGESWERRREWRGRTAATPPGNAVERHENSADDDSSRRLKSRWPRILSRPLDARMNAGKGTHHMNFAVGETVVYPHHGAALIEEVKTRTIKGEDRTYLKLKVAQGDLTIEVPAENVDLVGVRDVVDKEGLEEVFEVLRLPYTEEPTNWSRRYKANVEKLASGDVKKVAEVVRDLWRRDQDRGLSAGEKRMLAKARQILVSELALA